MNKKVILLIVLLAVAGVAAWYFISKSRGINTSILSVPAESSVVFTLDIKSIAEKAKLSEFKNSEVMSKMYDEMGDDEDGAKIKKVLEGIIDDPMSTGINFLTPFVGFVEMDKSRTNAGLVISISDADKFTNTLKSILPLETQIQEGADYRFIHDDGDNFVVAWSGKTAMIYKHKRGEGTMERLDSMMNHKIEHVGKNKAFKKFSGNKGEMGFFLNYGSLMKGNGGLAATGVNFPTEYYAFGNLKFEDGKIELVSETYFEKDEDRKKLEFVSSEKASDVLPYIASEKPVAYMNAKMDMEKIFNFLLETPEMASSVDEMAKSLSISRDDLKSMLSGELALSFGGVQERMVEKLDYEGNMDTSYEVVPQMNLFLGIANKEVFGKLISQSGLQKNADGYYQIPLWFINIQMVETEKGIVITMDPLETKKLATTGKLSDGKFGDVSDFSTSHSVTAYADLDIKNLNESTKNVLKNNMKEDGYVVLETALSPFSVLKMWNEGSQKSLMEITMKDASSNSLHQVLKMLESVTLKSIEMDEARQEKYRQMYEEDLREEDVVVGEGSM